MIYDGTTAHANGESSSDRQIGTSRFNSTYGDNAYVGYMMGINSGNSTSYEQTTTNTYNSTIKTYIDSWYKTNIEDTGYSDKVADVIYCNDRKIDNLSGYGNALGYGTNQTGYMARYRASINKIPILTCSQKNDAFTVNDIINGNGALMYPIGLITLDELVMGGGGYSTRNFNSSYYLYTGSYYWTMSPAYFNSSSGGTNVFRISFNGSIGFNLASASYGVRLVLSLKSDAKLLGSGTIDDPYVVQD